MKTLIFFVFVAVIFASTVAGPLEQVHDHHHDVLATNNDNHDVMIAPHDWLTELIESIFGADVIKFLQSLDKAMSNLNTIVFDAEAKLIEILQSVSAEAQAAIQAILDEAVATAKQILQPMLQQFGILMPAITRKTLLDLAAIIKALLGKTLEEFLRDIGTALDAINELLISTSARLQVIAETVAQGAAEKIMELIEQTLTEGEACIKPLLDVLNEIFENIDNQKKHLQVIEARHH